MQELHEAAEHLRQNEVKKADLKNLLWEKTTAWIRRTEYAQTTEVPATTTKAAGAGTKQGKKKTYVPDPLMQVIQSQMPHEADNIVGAHHFVESVLVPKFREGMPADIVQHYHVEHWTDDVKDAVAAFGCVCNAALVHVGVCCMHLLITVHVCQVRFVCNCFGT